MANEQSENEKLSKVSVHNTSKKIWRRDQKISSDFKSQMVSLQKESKLQVEQLAKLEKHLEYSQQVSGIELPVAVLLRLRKKL